MGQTKIICIGCPKGCPITVTYEDKTITNIEGFGCKTVRIMQEMNLLHRFVYLRPPLK